MARIVGGSPIGQLSGKMGGMVFAHNKSGPYVRRYAVPVNPNTGAQLSARASFAGAVGSFHSLTPAEKTQWQSFAQTAFNPKNAINIGQFSGINAYTALQQAVINGNKLLTSPTVGVNGTPLVTQPANLNLTFNDIPPVFTVQPNLKENGTGNAITYGDINGTIDKDGEFDITLNINPGMTGAPTLAGMLDAVDHKIGYAVYMSESHVQGGLFYNNPEKILLGVIPANDAGSTDLASVATIEFTGNTAVNTANYQAFPVAGNFVRLSVYAIDYDSGTLACIGTVKDSVSGNSELEVLA